jgi:carboxymethylenebutenolidase
VNTGTGFLSLILERKIPYTRAKEKSMFTTDFMGCVARRGLSGVALFSLMLFSGTGNALENPETIELRTSDGTVFPAYVSGPVDSVAGILMAHDWFGASPFYKETAVRLGELGYRVIAIDYYGGVDATTHKEANALMQQVNASLTAAKVRAGLDALKMDGRKVATFGFSLGAEYAYRGALNDPDVVAVALWYGYSPNTDEDIEGLNADVLVIQGSLDGPAADQGAAYSNAMDKFGKKGELYIYPQAQHAFAQPLFNAGKTYDPAGAEIAWLITTNFFARKLKDGS